MLFAEVVSTSAAVASTRSRLAKVTALATLLARLTGTAEVESTVAFLVGLPRQGKIGAGWRTLVGLAVPAAAEPVLTVVDVDEVLTAVAVTGGKGSTQRRADLLTGLLTKATAREQDFLRRLLTGELRQGALEGVMTDAVAAAFTVPVDEVRRAFMLSGQLHTTAAAALSGGATALSEFGLAVGRPLRPMLAAPAESLESALELGRVTVEYKLDGARIQVHKQGADVHVYTRTLREITASVPELVDHVRALPCESVVLDGETLALTDDGRPRPFQETMSRFGATSSRELLLHPYYFDCLHLDGEDLLDQPLSARLDALERVAGAFRIPGAVEPDLARAIQIQQAAAAAGHEGVMVKSLESPYAAGRRGKSWQKVKPVHTLDLVVLAAEWGHGRRRGFLSNLHLGARDPDGGPPVMVGKTFKGLTDELLTWQTAALSALATETEELAEDPLAGSGFGVVHVRPELVIEIELDGVQVSPRYPGGVALRFARVLRYRPDKEVREADTIEQVRALLPDAAPAD